MRTYTIPGPHEHQGGAEDLFYPGPPRPARECWGFILPRAPTNSKEVLGTDSTLGRHITYIGGAGAILPRISRGIWSYEETDSDIYRPGVTNGSNVATTNKL